MFDYDDTVNLAFDAKIAGKKLVTAKHELLTKTGDFLFLAHSDKELAQRMQMVEEDIEKVAYRKLANVSDSKAKLVRAIYDEWSIRHANCDFCKEAKNVYGGGGYAPAMQSMMTAVPGAKDPGIVKDVTDTAKGVAHAVGTGVGAVARGVGTGVKDVGTGAKDVANAVGNEITKLPGQVGDAVKSVGTGAKDVANAVGNEITKLPGQVGTGAKDVAHAVGTGVGAIGRGVGTGAKDVVNAVGTGVKDVGTGIADVAKGAISGAGSLFSQFIQGFQGNSTPAKAAPAAADKASGFSSAADVAAHQKSNNATGQGTAGTGSYTPARPIGPSNGQPIGQGPAPTAPVVPARPVGPSIGQGPAPKAPVAPARPIGPSNGQPIGQGPAPVSAPSAPVNEYSGQIPAIPHQRVDTSVDSSKPGTPLGLGSAGGGVPAPAAPAPAAPSSDSDADDMDRAASKIAKLSKLLKGSNDTNFIG